MKGNRINVYTRGCRKVRLVHPFLGQAHRFTKTITVHSPCMGRCYWNKRFCGHLLMEIWQIRVHWTRNCTEGGHRNDGHRHYVKTPPHLSS